MKAPDFWYLPEHRPTYSALFLLPFSWLWATYTAHRVSKKAKIRASIPVICVGNVTVGGTGKTPTALAIAKILIDHGKQPVFLTRGYGGEVTGPVIVNESKHTASMVGDEPLLLARCAPTVVARNRVEGVSLIEHEMQASHIIMDDGFQNPTVKKDLSLLVVDGQAGFGNCKVIPAGPLREPVYEAVERADALVLVGGKSEHVRLPDGIRTFQAKIAAAQSMLEAQQPVLAFAGIGRPEKFYATLRDLGVSLAGAVDFADHHPYSWEDEQRLISTAERLGAKLVTTEKDYVRLSPEFRGKVCALAVDLRFEATAEFLDLLRTKEILI